MARKTVTRTPPIAHQPSNGGRFYRSRQIPARSGNFVFFSVGNVILSSPSYSKPFRRMNPG